MRWDEIGDWIAALVVANNIATVVIAWFIRRVMADSVPRVSVRADAIESRVVTLEHLGKMMPTREDMHLLRLEMVEARGEMTGLVKDLERDRNQVGQNLASAERLVEKTERNLRMITEHLLNKGR